jgi:hypothetical protein
VEANIIATNHYMAKGEWSKIDQWREWRVRDYNRLKELGIPVYDPISDTRDSE